MTNHTITLERGRALLHALKRVDAPAEREADAARRELARTWRLRQHADTVAALAAIKAMRPPRPRGTYALVDDGDIQVVR